MGGAARFVEQGIQVFETKPGPGLICGRVLHGFGHRHKFRANNAAASTGNGLVLDMHDVNNSEMYVANFGAIVVNERDRRRLNLLD